MDPRTWTSLGLVALLAAAAGASAYAAPPPATNCETLPSGVIACGYAEASVCAGFGEGEATGLVDWVLRVRTSNWWSEKDYESPAPSAAFAGGGPAAVCTTSTCTWADLYADGVLIYPSMGICW
jgi:hypothetical protein